MMPQGLVSNLQEALLNRKGIPQQQQQDSSNDEVSSTNEVIDFDDSKPIVLVTNTNGVESPGLTNLVEALLLQGLYNVHVSVPQSDKSVCGHSVTLRETVEASSAKVSGADAFEISGTPVDCVSLALSGALFSWSKPLLVISGINQGSSCGHHMTQGGLGLQFAQLGRDASAAGAARRLGTQKKNLEIIESTGAAGKPDTNRVKKYFRLEMFNTSCSFTHEEVKHIRQLWAELFIKLYAERKPISKKERRKQA